jgi:hypothetical protein
MKILLLFLIKCKKLYRSKVKQSWKPASQIYRHVPKGTGSLEQINTTKKGICSLNKDIKTSKQQIASMRQKTIN